MKELSIEEKARAYDEAIKYAHYLINERCKENTDGSFHRADLNKMFSELAESEDERIKKNIKIALMSMEDNLAAFYSTHRTSQKELLAWLEKQGKQKPIISDDALREGIAHFGITQYQIDNWLKKYVDVEKQGEQKPADNKGMNLVEEKMTPFQKKVFCIIDTTIEKEQGLKQVCDELLTLASNEIKQKPTWSEEDEIILKTIISDGIRGAEFDMLQINWLKSLKERVQTQPKQEWSEEDEEEFQIAIDTLAEAGQNDSAHWLKSLKERYAWKPSDEQLDALYLAAMRGDEPKYKFLVELYKNLKKLKENNV